MHNTEVASHNAEYGSNDLVCLCIQLLSQAIFVIDVYGWLLNRKATRYIPSTLFKEENALNWEMKRNFWLRLLLSYRQHLRQQKVVQK